MSNVSSLGFAQRIDDETDLGGCETAGRVRETGLMEGIHQVRVMVYPLHELLAGSGCSDVGAIELGKLTFAVGLYFHFFDL